MRTNSPFHLGLPGRPARQLAVLASLSLAAACGVTNPSGPHAEEQVRLSEARAKWRFQGISDYTYVFSRSCFCVPEVREPATVTVRNRTVVSAANVSNGVPRDPSAYYSVEGLFGLVQDAIDRNAATIRTTYDSSQGYLTSAYFDFDERIADEEFSVEARALTPIR